MIKIKLNALMEERKMSRYRLQKVTNWNYKRVNAYYFGKVLIISIEELNKLCEIFKCRIENLIEYSEK